MNANEAVLRYTCCVKDGSHCCGEEKTFRQSGDVFLMQ